MIPDNEARTCQVAVVCAYGTDAISRCVAERLPDSTMVKTKMKRKAASQMKTVFAVDLFCGAGGLTHGLERSGVHVGLGIDIDPACEFPYTTNNTAKFLLKNIEEVTPEEILAAYPKNGLRLLAGCAPCQTFSTYYQKANKMDKRWHLLAEVSNIVQKVLPDLVTIENVPRLAEHDVFHTFVNTLENARYHVDYRVVNCIDYGIPQQRQRLVLLASRLGPIQMQPPFHNRSTRPTVRSAIGALPSLNAGEVYPNDPLHQCSSLSPLNMKRIKASMPGGTWRDWSDNLVAECHKRQTGKTYASVYGRMCWDEPAPTITTQFYGFGNGRFGHPEQDRAISLREGAILQSFPNDYVFIEPDKPICKTSIGKLIGNAVPVKLGEVIGESIFAHLAHRRNGGNDG